MIVDFFATRLAAQCLWINAFKLTKKKSLSIVNGLLIKIPGAYYHVLFITASFPSILSVSLAPTGSLQRQMLESLG